MQPEPVRDIDTRFRAAVRSYHRVRWTLVSVLLVISLAGLAVFGVLYTAAAARIRASCQFYADLAGAPVVGAAPGRQPSVLAVRIVSDSRLAWKAEGCPGRLVRPAPSFAYWAARMRIPVVTAFRERTQP